MYCNRLLFKSGFINYWILGSVKIVLKTPFSRCYPSGVLTGNYVNLQHQSLGWWDIDRESWCKVLDYYLLLKSQFMNYVSFMTILLLKLLIRFINHVCTSISTIQRLLL